MKLFSNTLIEHETIRCLTMRNSSSHSHSGLFHVWLKALSKRDRHFIFIVCISLSLTACQTFSAQDQRSNIENKQHPLIDKIWSVREHKYLSADSLQAQILENEAILLGETHDNVRHHQIQAQIINELIQNRRTPAIAFEMLNQNQQDTIIQFQKEQEKSQNKTDAFARVINWEQSGWPEWSFYRPVFRSAIENNLPVIAANLDIKQIRKVIKQGSKALDTNYQYLLHKYQYDDALKKELEQEILAAHCDLLPEKMLSPMLLGQQTRDLAMTQAMQSSLLQTQPSYQSKGGVVLIAGSGHTRKDYGVPYYLQQEMPELKIISIAFMEVRENLSKPTDYAEAWGSINQLPFDVVWFTPKTEREDQCEKMKAHMKKKNK